MLCILQILLAENCFISPLAGSAAAVLTDTGWPLQTRPSSAKQWPLGHRPLADEWPTQVLCYVSPGFESPGEGAVLIGTEDRQLRQGGGGQQRGPARLPRAGAPSVGGFLLQVSYSFDCPGTGVGTTRVL